MPGPIRLEVKASRVLSHLETEKDLTQFTKKYTKYLADLLVIDLWESKKLIREFWHNQKIKETRN
jgi:hypothetical protein